jgi:hypothetical protein
VRKKPHDIQVHVVHQTVDEVGLLSDQREITVVTLDLKLYEYAVRVGSAMAGIVIQLFTQGKVRVHFGSYSERLELVDPSDRMSGPAAMELFDDFVATVSNTGIQLFKKATQQIFVKLHTAATPGLKMISASG